MRKEIIGEQVLYLGDMREIVPALGGVDMILTDPPYRLTSGGPSGMLGGIFDSENYANDGAIVKCDIDWPDFMPLLSCALPRGHAYIMANNRNVLALLTEAERAGFGFHNLLVWDKINATANRWYMKNLEFVGFFYKGLANPINDCSSKQLIRCPQVDETKHPTEKPVPLMQHYITNSTIAGNTVLDPFMGTGTTLVACAKLNRRGIGIEIEEKWFDTACKRVEKAVRQTELFGAV